MLQSGESFLRQPLTPEGEAEFSILPEMRAAGMVDYVAIINRFSAEHKIGDMDGVYSSWATARPGGFTVAQTDALQSLAPFLALAIKSAALERMLATLMETYLGRDAGQRVLGGRIVRGVADRIDAVIWFSDLRGFTRITDTTPEHVIPLLNDYAEVIVTSIHQEGGDVLKLIGDGTLAIFVADDQEQACNAAIAAAVAARRGVSVLNQQRAAEGVPVTEMYLGLHVGPVFYGNVGGTERLDFPVVGPAVNEAKPDRRHVPFGRPADPVVAGLRKRRRHPRAHRVGWPLCPAGRRATTRAFHARPDRVELARGLRYATHAFTSRLLIQRWRRSRRRTSIA